MKIAFVSDIHIDFYINELNPQSPKFKAQMEKYINKLNLPEANALIIAGDIGHYFNQNIAFLLELKKLYKDIIVTFGNHDLFLINKSIQNRYKYDSFKRLKELKNWCNQNDIHFLDGNTILINGVKIAGTSMSWDYAYGKKLGYSESFIYEKYKEIMNDSNLIYQDGKRHINIPLAYGGAYINPSFKADEFFKREKEKLNNIEYCDIIITHYGPKFPNGLEDDIENSFYFFDGLEDIKRINPKYWIFGHIHESVDEIYNNTNLLCNPIGYPGQNDNIIKILEI